MTDFPFQLSPDLVQRMPRAARDGMCYLDVQVYGRWYGIIVSDAGGKCVGVYVRRQIVDYPIPFAPVEIEDIRHASLWNRALAEIPFNFYDASVVTIVFISPIGFLCGWFLHPLFVILSLVICLISVYVMYLVPGFPFTRFPVATFGLAQIISSGIVLLKFFSTWLKQ